MLVVLVELKELEVSGIGIWKEHFIHIDGHLSALGFAYQFEVIHSPAPWADLVMGWTPPWLMCTPTVFTIVLCSFSVFGIVLLLILFYGIKFFVVFFVSIYAFWTLCTLTLFTYAFYCG